MLLLHKTEAEIEEGMSPYIIERLGWVMQQDSEYEAAEQASREADSKLKSVMGAGSRPTVMSRRSLARSKFSGVHEG